MPSLPKFSLRDSANNERSFPDGRPTLLCFVREECPTCGLSMPLVEAAHRAFGKPVDIWAVGQEDNEVLVDRYKLTVPMLDDTALKVSFVNKVEIVPTVVLADSAGAEIKRFVGFEKSDWQDIFARLSQLTGIRAPTIDWGSYPSLRQGCGSKSVEPGFAERLAAEAEGSPIRARMIEIADQDDPYEFFFDKGLTDGLPIILPTPERVIRMLSGTRRDAQEVVGILPPSDAPVTIEKIAINAVMAGCKPEYFPVVIATVEAICDPRINAYGMTSTTSGATPLIVVNGPIRKRLGMNMETNVLGNGNRANATIGRAVKLIQRNIGHGRPGEHCQATLSSPGSYSCCFPEFEERSPWEPLHVTRGFDKNDSVVTVFANEGSPHQISDHTSRTARALVGSIALGVEAIVHPKAHDDRAPCLLVVSPEHADTLRRDGWSRQDVCDRIQAFTSRTLRELLPSEDSGGIYHGLRTRDDGVVQLEIRSEEELGKLIPKFHNTELISIVVAGGPAGKVTAAFPGWGGNSLPVSRKIEEMS